HDRAFFRNRRAWFRANIFIVEACAMTPDEALGAVAGVKIPSKPTEADLEVAGLTTGVLVLLAALWSLLGHYLSSRSRYLNESGTACLLGLVAGVALLAWRDTSNAGLVNGLLRFNSAAFFTYLLPPVIFYAGLSVEQRRFFSNLPSILSFGVLGTLLSFVLMSAALYSLGGTTFGLGAQDCLALGAVFAATDSVAVLGLLDPRTNPQLFSLVFGEGIVNDATSVVLLGALARMARQQESEPGGAGEEAVLVLAWRLMWNFGYLLLSSTLLGFVVGVGVAALLRGRAASEGPHHEVALVGLLSYLAYLAAEVLGLSAILSLFCCGATVSHFALRNGAGGAEEDRSGRPGLAGLRSCGSSSELQLPSTNVSVHGGAAGGDRAVDGGGCDPGGANGEVGIRSRYGAYMPVAAEEYEGSGGGGGGSVFWALTAPAKRLAARAFGGGLNAGCMSPAGAMTTMNAFRSLSYVAEGLIFIYLGMDCLDPERWKASYPGEVVWLVGVLLFFLLGARAVSVIPLSMLHNLYAPRHQRLSGRDMMVIWWSGLMRGAVSVALVYLNFDTLDGSVPLQDAIISPHRASASGGTGGGSRRRRRRARGLLQLVATDIVSDAAAASTSDPAASAALALAAALVEADEQSARQHATLIVSTLLAVVASVLVVSTLTKPVLQAAMEADPRKSPLKVLSEALCDPWVDATWRLKVALGRSYHRWMRSAGGASTAANGEMAHEGVGAHGSSGVAAGSGIRRGSSCIHTIPMASLGHGVGGDWLARGQSGPNATGAAAAALMALSPGLAVGTGLPGPPAGSDDFSPTAAASAAPAARPRGASLQQRSAATAAAAAALADRPGPGSSNTTTTPAATSTTAVSGVCVISRSPSPSPANLQYKTGHEGDRDAGLSPTGGHGATTTASDIRGHGANPS
ncbi:hypothetical protein Vafri_16056, partial [Volvox africanus]